jgi:phosphohistidine phosphatase SixA
MTILSKSLLLALALTLLGCAVHAECAHPPAQLILVRHGCKLDPEDHHSLLSPNGNAQARELVGRLAAYDVAAIFTTEEKRTQETAAAVASTRHLTPVVRPATGEAAKQIVAEVCASETYAAKAVVYVGHSNTVSDALAGLGLDPKTPGCAEGWVITFEGKKPVPSALPSTTVKCEKPC